MNLNGLSDQKVNDITTIFTRNHILKSALHYLYYSYNISFGNSSGGSYEPR